MGKKPNRFFQRRYPNDLQVHKEILNITNHQENVNQNHMRYHLTPVRMPIIKKTGVSVGQDVKKREPLCTVGDTANWCGLSEKQYGGSKKN